MKWLVEYKEGPQTFWNQRPSGGIVIAEDAYSALKESAKIQILNSDYKYRITHLPETNPVVFAHYEPDPFVGWKAV